LDRWKNDFRQLLNVPGINRVRQRESHISEPLIPEHSCCGVETAIEKLKRYKSPDIDQVPAELM